MRFIDIISPKKWKLVLIFILKKFLYILGDTARYIPQHEIEQKAYRLAKCYDCFEEGKCHHCGCDTIGLINVASAQCSLEKWGVLLSEEEWKEFKKEYILAFHADIKRITS